jgi:ADP-heptose:LPS heptosyltransferase
MMRVRPEEVADCVPYLHAPRPAPDWVRGRVGLCWRAGDWDAARSVSLADLLAGLHERPPFVSLQRGPAAMEATSDVFANPADNDMDMARTAALVAGCSRVVTVDTAVAHLAGAMGIPGLVVLQESPDWRWAVSNGRSVWYPSLNLVRKSPPERTATAR